MTPSELKSHVEQYSNFFERSTMRFFGDTMKNYGCRKVTIGERDLYELYRKRPVKHGLSESAYFDAETFTRVFPNIEQ